MKRCIALGLLLAASLLTGCGEALVDDGFAPPDAERPVGFGDAGTYDDGGYSGGGSSGGSSGGGNVPAPPPAPPCNEVTFTYQDASASSVWVTGSFTGWAATLEDGAVEMTPDGSGKFQVTTLVDRGTNEYKFVVNGTEWVTDPSNDRTSGDGVFANSVLNVCGESGPTSCGDFDWRSSVMYFAMVDRFYDSDGMRNPVQGSTDGDAWRGPSGDYEGGDLKGVTEKIPYLADLGVTSLWLSAPYDNRDYAGAAINPAADRNMYSAYHGYWPKPENIDWSNPVGARPQVENRIGTSDDLHSLVDTAHSATTADGHGMKVMFDYVMNHVDADSGLYKAHRDWFATDNGRIRLCGPENLWNDPYWGTRCAFTDYLPVFDFDIPEAREWSIEDALYWAKEYDIDGYRLDAIKHVSFSWLTDLRRRLNAEITDAPADRFYLVGETFDYNNRDLLKSFVDPDTMLDGQFDFPFKRELCEAVFKKNKGMNEFSTFMHGNDTFYGPGAIMTTWIGNHDIPRAIHFASGQISECWQGSDPGNGWNPNAWQQPQDAAPYERLGVAFAVMFTNPGIPLLYYGDEVGLAGGGDPDNRRMMPWSNLNTHQELLREKVRELATIRGQHPVLGRGTRTTLSADSDTWVYTMSGCGGEVVTVAINRADQGRSVQIPAGDYEMLPDGANHAGGTVMLGARDYLILRKR